jgi:hypothetical protein
MTTTKKSRARKAQPSPSTSSTSNTPRYSAAASKRVESPYAPQREKKAAVKAGAAGKASAAKNREQAIAISLSGTRKAGAKAQPRKPAAAARKSRSARQPSSRQKQV